LKYRNMGWNLTHTAIAFGKVTQYPVCAFWLMYILLKRVLLKFKNALKIN